MNNVFKLALLGCASSCLMTAAYANAETKGFERVSIEGLDVEDMVCGAEKRTYHFEIKNNGLERVYLGPLFIDIDEDTDSFPENRFAVYADKNCFVLNPLGTCKGVLTIDPAKLSCAKLDHPMVFDADIERTLLASYFMHDEDPSTDAIRFARAPIDADVNLLGSLTDYALIADIITAGTDEISAMDSITTVEGNVSAVDFNASEDLDDLAYNCEYGTCGYVDYDADGFGSFGAFADAAQAWSTFRGAVFDEDGETDDCANADYILDLSGKNPYQEIYPGFYCVTSNGVIEDGFYSYAINGTLAFKGDEDDVFVFAFPDNPDGNGTPTGLGILSGASFSLTSDHMGTTVDNRNIFWVLPVDSEVAIEGETRFAGNIITAGDVIPLNLVPDLTAPYIMGGIYGLDEIPAVAGNEASDCESSVTVDGFSIDSDSNDD